MIPTEIPKIDLKMTNVSKLFEKLEPSAKLKFIRSPKINGYLRPQWSANWPDNKHPKKNPIKVEDPRRLCWLSESFHSFSKTGIKKDRTNDSAPSAIEISAFFFWIVIYGLVM